MGVLVMATNTEVAHRWATGGKGIKGSNFYCTDDGYLVSYNTTVGFNTGKGVVFISPESMSPSTGRQLSYARRAASHLIVVPSPVFVYGRRLHWGTFNVASAYAAAIDSFNTAVAAANKSHLTVRLHYRLESLAAHSLVLSDARFALNLDPIEIATIDYDLLDRARAYSADYDRKRRERDEKRAAMQRVNDRATYDKWLAGEPVRCPSSYFKVDGSMSLARRGDMVYTSGGASVTLEQCRRALAFWSACVSAGREYRRNGHSEHVGPYVIQSIDLEGNVKIGCHDFSRAAIVDFILRCTP